MPKGIYKHKSNQGFQKGNKLGLGRIKSSEEIENIKKRNTGLKRTSEAIEKNRQAKLKNPVRYWLGKKRIDMIGMKHWNWKGGITNLRQQVYHSKEYKNWRKLVFERDNHTCQKCSQIGGRLNAHHKKEFYKIILDNNIISMEQTKLCIELWDISNGITLCYKCHSLIREFYGNQYVKN